MGGHAEGGHAEGVVVDRGRRDWVCKDRRLTLGGRTRVMGIVNVTPDSFYDGGQHASSETAIAHGLRLLEEGADILDVGGESSRPGAEPVSLETELARVIPVIEGLRARSDAVVSIDTTKSEVARQALAAGAQIINDISGLRHDAAMVEVAVSTGAGVVLMHMQGQPGTMQMNPHYDDVVREIHDFFESRLQVFDAAGMDRAAVVLDPGIGFGKRFEDNWRLLARLPELAAGGLPLLLGVSRKRFLGELCDRPVDERLPASLAALTATILAGAAVVRVHDVKESCDAARVADRLRAETEQHGGMDTTTALA